MTNAPAHSDWLAQLAPEHAPAIPPWWPPAPGWWLLAALTLLLIAAAVWWWRWPPRRLRRVALRELRRIRARDADPAATARALQNLLRRYALAVFGADQVARLSGTEWLCFVAAHGADGLAGPLGEALLAASFGGRSPAREPDADRAAWCAATERFVRTAAQAKQRRTQP
jgi:hypothetical protein